MYETNLYKKYLKGHHWKNPSIVYSKKFVEFLKSEKFKGWIVDIGCGDGRDVDIFSSAGISSLGIDYSKSEVKKAKQKYPNLKFEVQNVENLKLKNNSVEAFFMINVIHYVDQKKSVGEIFRVLKPKGYFFVQFNLDIVDGKGKVDFHQDQIEILKLISGFKIIRKKIIRRIDSYPVMHKHKIIELILQKK